MPTVKEQQEKEWIQLIARGDEAAFTALFDAYKDRIYTIALRLTGSGIQAEEIVQDVFLKLWLKRETLAAVEHFRAYLFTSTRNRVFDTLKRMVRRQQITAEMSLTWPAEQSDTDNLLLDKEYQAILHEAVERLPERQREIYRLMKEQGLKRHQVAEQLDISPETVKMHLSQAMRSIRAFCVSRLDLYIALVLFESFHK